jgi:hypothetical protein
MPQSRKIFPLADIAAGDSRSGVCTRGNLLKNVAIWIV